MSRVSSKKKCDSHGCCHCFQYAEEVCVETEQKSFNLVREWATCVRDWFENGIPNRRVDESVDDEEGYVPYVELKSNVKPAFVLCYQILVMSPILFLFAGYVSVWFASGQGGVTVDGIKSLYEQSSSPSFREGIVGVCGPVIGAVLALAAFSWVRHQRPENPTYTRVWVTDILEDSLKEMASCAAVVVLSALFGTLTMMYWVSIFSARRSGDPIGGELLIGVVLTVLSAVVYLAPLLLSATGNVLQRERVRTLQDIVSYSRLMLVSRDWGDCRKISQIGCVARFALIFFVASVSMGISWWMCGGRKVSALAIGGYVGVVAVYFVQTKIYFSIKLSIRGWIQKAVFMVVASFFCLLLVLIFWLGMNEVSGRPIYSLLAAVAGLWWIIPMYFYGILRRLPVLAGLNGVRFRKEIEGLSHGYERLFYDEGRAGQDAVAIVNEVLPAGIVVRSKVGGRLSWAKTWSQRSVMMVPKVRKSRKAGSRDVDLRSYIEGVFDVILPGSEVSALSLQARSPVGTVDEWHVESSC